MEGVTNPVPEILRFLLTTLAKDICFKVPLPARKKIWGRDEVGFCSSSSRSNLRKHAPVISWDERANKTNKVSSAYCFEKSHHFWADFNDFSKAAGTGMFCLSWTDDTSVLNQFPADREKIAICLIVPLLQTSRHHFWRKKYWEHSYFLRPKETDRPAAIGSIWEHHVVCADFTPQQWPWLHNHSQRQLSPHAFYVL